MKKFILVLLLMTALANAQIINIPDPIFKARLLSASPTNNVAKNSSNAAMTIDENGDGEIQLNEAHSVYQLFIRGSYGVSSTYCSSLSGIEYFTNLNSLNCPINFLTTLDVTALTNLTYLNFSNNQLSNINLTGLTGLTKLLGAVNNFTTLDLTAVPNLQELNFRWNSLTSLNVSGICNNISILVVEVNNFTTLDVSGLHNLAELYVGANPNLTSLYLKNGAIEQISIPQLPNLQYICVDPVQQAQVQALVTNSGYTSCVVDSSCTLSTANFDTATAIVTFPNPAQNMLNIKFDEEGHYQSISIYNTLGQLVLSPIIDLNHAAVAIDISSLKPGTYFLRVDLDKGTKTGKFLKE